MSVFLYNVFLLFFRAGIWCLSFFNPKAKKWISGRRGIFERLQLSIRKEDRVIWMHCASLGEFEQGRPLMEAIRLQYPGHRILLTFFSPSGYEVQKEYPGADWVFYLPLDGPRTARRFLEITHPSLVIFVKYEFWYYYLKKIKYRNIPLLLISALFRTDMSFFKWYGGLQRKILSRFDHLFVQNSSSLQLITSIGLGSISSISGDTRFDRVSQIAGQWKPNPILEEFCLGKPTVMAGSSWPEDEILLKEAFEITRDAGFQLILAPHEINTKHLDELAQLFPGAVTYSSLARGEVSSHARVLLIDNMGMLSSLYRYAWCCWIGGGLRKSGVHNVLEAAVYGKPVFFGPAYTKYSEAVELVAAGGASPVNDSATLSSRLISLSADRDAYDKMALAAGNFVRSHIGAVEKITRYIQEKRLLTN